MPKIFIRQLSIEDASISFRWRNDPEIWQYTASRPENIVTEEIEKNWLAEKLSEKNSSRFAIIADDQYVGNIQITDIIEKDKGQYHIFIGEKSFWYKGIGRQATAQIIRFAKEKLNLKELYLVVNPKHAAAIKLYEHCGFVKINDDIRMRLNLSLSKPPFVSVYVLKCNHEQYITQALEGILLQNTNFDFDIVVGEDFSTDGKRKIVLDYADKYPGKFKLLLHGHNIETLANRLAVLRACTGKYVAMCEGDDYWTDPYKLQKQSDFLENNNQYSMCFTKYSVVDSVNQIIAENLGYEKDLSHEEIFSKYCPPATSVLFRSEALNKCLDFKIWSEVSYGDHALFAFITRNGKAKSFSCNSINYRVHKEGVWRQ